MSRYRPPAAGSSPYVTAEGFSKLEQELKHLWTRRSEVTAALAAAAAEGDRSENAEYIYRKKELRELDRRLGYLQRRIPRLRVVGEVQDRNKVYFGARVTLEDKGGVLYHHRVVGPDEIDTGAGHISVDSPLARRLLGKGRDDEIELRVRGQESTFVILDIDYE